MVLACLIAFCLLLFGLTLVALAIAFFVDIKDDLK